MCEYISREAAADRIRSRIDPFSTLNHGLYQALREIEATPAADVVEVRHGLWKEALDGHLFCSGCGFRLDDEGYYDSIAQEKENKFCKNCGAKMDGGVNEELVGNVNKFKWIKIESRPMDEEERKELSERIGYDIEYEDAIIYTSELPDDGQEVLVCNKWGHVWIDTFSNDPDYGVGFENNGDMDGIVAWMPLPEPPNGVE